MADVDDTYLSVRDLAIGVDGKGSDVKIVDGVSFELERRGSLGIVGESGSGKSMLCRALLGTLPRYGTRLVGGQIAIAGRDLTYADEQTWRKVRGRDLGYVPQSSLAGLNPVLTVEAQLLESLRVGRGLRGDEAYAAAVELVDLVRIPRARAVLAERSHQLSGGMRQRIMIAAALALKPPMLILDEPTTALDVTVQFEILSLIRSLGQDLGMGIVLVSHDLGVIEFLCEKVMTMYAGATVELGATKNIRTRPRHPYTRALSESRLSLASKGKALTSIPGESPSVGSWPDGCRFHPRCEFRESVCTTGSQPKLRTVGDRLTACIRSEEIT